MSYDPGTALRRRPSPYRRTGTKPALCCRGTRPPPALASRLAAETRVFSCLSRWWIWGPLLRRATLPSGAPSGTPRNAARPPCSKGLGLQPWWHPVVAGVGRCGGRLFKAHARRPPSVGGFYFSGRPPKRRPPGILTPPFLEARTFFL